MARKIISHLEKFQKERGLTDKEMGEKLGCSRQLYQKVRSGKVPLGAKLIKGVMGSFPQLRDDVIYFLSNDAHRLPNGGN